MLGFSPLGVRLNLNCLEVLSLHPRYRVSLSNSISALCLYRLTHVLHQLTHRMSGTLKAFLAALGSFFNINSRVYVVTIAALVGFA